jgi:hypothetical protein
VRGHPDSARDDSASGCTLAISDAPAQRVASTAASRTDACGLGPGPALPNRVDPLPSKATEHGTLRSKSAGSSAAAAQLLQITHKRSLRTLTRFSEKGRPFTTASCARRTFAAATSFIASVIFLVPFTDVIRSRSCLMLALQTCAQAVVAPPARARRTARLQA